MRLTMPRQIILQVLQDSEELQSAEDIFVQVHQDHPGIGIATVYRTLQLLTELGVAARVDTGDGKSRYRLSQGDTPLRRIVLSCRRCGRAFPIPQSDEAATAAVEGLVSGVSSSRGFSVEQSIVQLVGLCSDCRNEAAPGSSEARQDGESCHKETEQDQMVEDR